MNKTTMYFKAMSVLGCEYSSTEARGRCHHNCCDGQNCLAWLSDRFVELEKLRKENRWIPVGERLPEEHDSMFAKFYGTEQWSNVMWKKQSDQVNVVLGFEDGTRTVSTLYTHDEQWKYTNKIVKQKVTHWQPLPQPPSTGEGEM